MDLDSSRTGKPTDNTEIDALSGRLREQCLNQCWFSSLDEAKKITQAGREDYIRNRARKPALMQHRTPFVFARRADRHAICPPCLANAPAAIRDGIGLRIAPGHRYWLHSLKPASSALGNRLRYCLWTVPRGLWQEH